MAAIQIKEGEVTSTIYGMIRDQRYGEAAAALNNFMQTYQKSRAALSLLGYCYYQQQDFVNAADCYEQLSILHPEVEDYKLYYAQSLHRACLYEESMKVSCQVDSPQYTTRILKLQAAIRYGEEDLPGAQSLVEQCPSDDPDTEINLGCLLFKEGNYETACKKFTTAMQVLGYKPDLSYNIALCHYSMKQYAPALKHIADIIEKGIREHPELSVGMTTEGIDVRSVGNTLTLHETALVEAFNLKAAIEYQLKNYEASCEALTDMPPRTVEELDAVTLHNQALMNMEEKPTNGFEKLQFLLQQNPFPPETFSNLLLLYVKYEYYDLAADVLAENAHLTTKYMTPYLYDFLEAVITRQTSPEEAYRKLDEMASKQTESLRKLTKQVVKKALDKQCTKDLVKSLKVPNSSAKKNLLVREKCFKNPENYTDTEKNMWNEKSAEDIGQSLETKGLMKENSEKALQLQDELRLELSKLITSENTECTKYAHTEYTQDSDTEDTKDTDTEETKYTLLSSFSTEKETKMLMKENSEQALQLQDELRLDLSKLINTENTEDTKDTVLNKLSTEKEISDFGNDKGISNKMVQESRNNHDDEAVKKAVNEYDEALERYIPVLMQQAKIYWDLENYAQVEKIFRKSVEFCNEHDTWKLNVAHVLFMQENKFKEATGFYEPIVKKHYDNILKVSAIVLANLCVSYIMTSQNEEAEELMRKIEKEEEQISYEDPEKKIYHLCIVNLVIGTLYCAKGNYEFGISRVIKSLEPYQKKLGTDTWYYAKRCFLSLIENMAKHMIMLRDAVLHECIQFLEHCEMYGKDVKAMTEQPLEEEPQHPGKNTVTYEARQVKALLIKLM